MEHYRELLPAIVDQSLEPLREHLRHLQPVEHERHHQEAGVEAELLEPHREVGRAGLGEVAAVENGLVEDVGLEQEADLAAAQVLGVVELPDPGRDLPDLPPLQPRLHQPTPLLLLELPQPGVGLEHLVEGVVVVVGAGGVRRQVPHAGELLVRRLHQAPEQDRDVGGGAVAGGGHGGRRRIGRRKRRRRRWERLGAASVGGGVVSTRARRGSGGSGSG